MKNNNQEQQIKSNSLSAVTTGIVIGAGIVAAFVTMLQDKKNREKIKKVLKDVKKQLTGNVEDVQKKAEEKIEEGKEKLIEGKEEVKHKAKKIIDSTQDALKESKKNL